MIKTMTKTGYFKVKIAKHTPLLFGNKYENMWHVNNVGDTILVKKTANDGTFYEAKNGNSILKNDCEIVKEALVSTDKKFMLYIYKRF